MYIQKLAICDIQSYDYAYATMVLAACMCYTQCVACAIPHNTCICTDIGICIGNCTDHCNCICIGNCMVLVLVLVLVVVFVFVLVIVFVFVLVLGSGGGGTMHWMGWRNSRKTARPEDSYRSLRSNLAGDGTPARLQDRKIPTRVLGVILREMQLP